MITEKDYGPDDFRLHNNTSMVLVAPSRGGKTQLSLAICLNRNDIYKEPIENVLYFYQQYQSVFDDIKKQDPSIVFTDEKSVVEEQVKLKKPLLLIIDDYMLEAIDKDSKFIDSFFTEHCHHNNCSLIYLMQSLHPPKGKIQRQNTHYMCLFKIPGDARAVQLFSYKQHPEDKEFVYNAYKLATKEKYGYLFINNYPTCEEVYRYRNSVFPMFGGIAYVNE